MSDEEPAPGKRRRAAAARDVDYAYADDDADDDYEERPVKPRAPPKPKAPKPPPAPKIVLTVTPLAQELTKEEQTLLDKYAKLREIMIERRSRVPDAAPAREATAAAEQAAKKAMADLSQQMKEEQEQQEAARPKNRPSRKLQGPPRPSAGAATDPGVFDEEDG
jgi:hypothetical protein